MFVRSMQPTLAQFLWPVRMASLALLALTTQNVQAEDRKPTIVEMINLLKPGSLHKAKGKWVQTWVEDSGFEGVGPAMVDIPNGFASFADSGTGAGGISHEFAVYFPEHSGAILVHNFQDDRDTYVSELKFFQLRDGQLGGISSLLPRVSCRALATPNTIKIFYENPRLTGAANDPLLPTYVLPRKGTAISASCDTNKNRFNIAATMSGEDGLDPDAQAQVLGGMSYPKRLEFLWNKKSGAFSQRVKK